MASPARRPNRPASRRQQRRARCGVALRYLSRMKRIGIVGTGSIGRVHARHAARVGLPVVAADGALVGILTLQDIESAEKGMTAGAACTRQMEMAFPDETLNLALRRMSRRDLGRLPVVDRANPRRLQGMLRRADIIRAYDIALTRRTAQRHREHAVRLDAMTPARVDVSDVVIEPGAPVAGKKMKEIPFPQGCLVASLRRGGEVLIPHGETVLYEGDVLVVVAQAAELQDVLRLCRLDALDKA